MSVGLRRQRQMGREAAEQLSGGAPENDLRMLLPAGVPDAWIAFDQEVRRVHRSWYGRLRSDWPEVRLCHHDGRVREEALRSPHHPPELVAIRCADWVPAVRERARDLLARSLRDVPEVVLRRLTPLVVRLSLREQGAWALEQFEAALRRESTVLAELCGSADLPTRRFAARLALAAGLFDVRELAQRAAAEKDPLTSRLWADAALAVMAGDGPDDEAIDALLTGHIPMVRAGGVTALRRAGRAAEAAHHLADRSSLVRACARWLVGQDGGDPYELYRALVTDPARVTPYAVTGFAECARRADAPLLRALLAHPVGGVRAAAIAGLRLLGTTDVELLRPLLEDPSPAVAREASRNLLPSAGRLPADWLAARMRPGQPQHVRRAAYRLLRARGGVPGLRASVELLTDGDPALRIRAGQHIQSMWSPYRPPELPAGNLEVGALLDRCSELFSDYVMRRMRSQLGLLCG